MIKNQTLALCLQTHQIKLLNEEAAKKLKAPEVKAEADTKPDSGGKGLPSSAEGPHPPAVKEEPPADASKPGDALLPHPPLQRVSAAVASYCLTVPGIAGDW